MESMMLTAGLTKEQEQALNTAWKSEFFAAIKKNDSESFFPSDIRKMCILLPPRENAVGNFFRQLIRLGFIMKTGLYRPSPARGRHGGIEFEYKLLNH